MDEVSRATPRLAPDERPGLAMIANCMAPYRANLHALIAEGIPELKLHTLISHGPAEFDWSVNVPESIHANYFGERDDSPLAGPLHAPLREWRKGKRLIDYLQVHRVRAVVCQGYRYPSYLRTMRYCHRHGIPVFYRNDSNIRSDERLSRGKQVAKGFIYRCWMPWVDGIMSMGEYGDQFFLKYGAVGKPLYRVPCTPDYDFFARVDPRRLYDLCQRFKLSKERKYALYSGRLVRAKRVDLLIDAFAAIADERPQWDLLIVGDGPLREELQKRVPERLERRFIWTGFLEQPDCVAAYHAAEVLFLPSDHEPWALVVQEAMAAGLTVVASDSVGAARELVEDRVSGRICPVGNLAALEEAMLDATDSSKIAGYRAQSLAALSRWRQRIDPVAEIRRALVDNGVLETKLSSA
ncbi:MAG TPA: glycosyltransferase family 4 protein [Lacipirellulaceae bacterium]|jgi:glycosyltransferase involved in cell wall biosynthesis